jgi:hypothetical protein
MSIFFPITLDFCKRPTEVRSPWSSSSPPQRQSDGLSPGRRSNPSGSNYRSDSGLPARRLIGEAGVHATSNRRHLLQRDMMENERSAGGARMGDDARLPVGAHGVAVHPGPRRPARGSRSTCLIRRLRLVAQISEIRSDGRLPRRNTVGRFQPVAPSFTNGSRKEMPCL